jgi:hypothetical protein
MSYPFKELFGYAKQLHWQRFCNKHYWAIPMSVDLYYRLHKYRQTRGIC